MATKYEKKRAFKYKDVVLSALEKHFTSKTHIGFTKSEITRKVILEIMEIRQVKKAIADEIRIEIREEEGYRRSAEDNKRLLTKLTNDEFEKRCKAMVGKVYPNVHREIKKALGKEIIELSPGRFAPNNLQYERNTVIDKIVFEVEFLREDVAVVSSRMVVLQISEKTITIAKELFKELLKQNCYSVMNLDNNLILVLTGDKKECENLVVSIVDLVGEGFQIQKNGHKKRLTRLKLSKEF